MAEIKIVKKKQVWLWLLAGFVIPALLVYFLIFRSNGRNIEVINEANDITNTSENYLLGVNENNNIVADFVSFVENDTNRISLDLAYIEEALLKLTSATNVMAEEIGYDVLADLDKVKASAILIANEPFETSYAKNIRNATDNASTALQNMQLAKYPGLTDEVEELKNASTSINPKVLTLEQKNTVMNYFAKAANLLQKMN